MLKRNPESPLKDLQDMVRRMAWMAEYRDPDTLNHLERIRGYVSALALGFGLSTADVEIIAMASQLHDVGKVGLPDNLRVNTGSLSRGDLEETKTHTIYGADLLRDSAFKVFQIGQAICMSHHERWDGSGYPNGYRGDQIPLSAQLVGLADVFDALTTSRPYKREVPLADARGLIVQASGQLFDPKLVRIFDDQFDEIVRIRQANI
jgi:putative two-component system response regulator